jgi:hypothetical protein
MTKKEIRETRKMLMDALQKDKRWHNAGYNIIYYVGEHEGFQVWDPGNTDEYSWGHPDFVLYDSKKTRYKWVILKEADKLMSVLMKKYPDFFSEEGGKRRTWKRRLNELQRYFIEPDRFFFGDEYVKKKYSKKLEEIYRYKAEAEKEEEEED